MSSSSRVPSQPHYHPRPALALGLRLLAALLLALGLLGPLPIAYADGNLTVRVYSDSDRDGAYNLAEPAVPGVTVRVYNQDNVLVGLNSTAADGTIAFPTLRPGAYRVEVAPSAARAVSLFGAFPPGNGLVSFVALPDNTTQTLDVGVRPLAGGVDVGAPLGTRSVVARLWDDQDANGIQDAAEPGIPGLQVAIIDVVSNSVVVPAVTTNAEGYAVFSDTAPTGTGFALRVLSPVPTGYALTRPDANDGGFNPDQRDSDAALTAGNVEAPIIPGDTGANNDSIDIGFARGGISGFIFRDVNRNGGFDGVPESFLNGISVELRDSANAIVDTQVTRPVLDSPSGDAGFFEFAGISLAGGPYTLVVPSATFVGGAPLFGAANSPNAVGGDKGLINGTAPSGVVGPTDTVQIRAISITGADTGAFSNRSADNNFGFYQGSVGDLVWFDLDRDGVVDPGEDTQGINGVRLFVDDGRGGGTPGDGVQNGGEPSTLTTVSGLRPGFYRFDNLPLGVAPGRQYEIVLDEANFLPGGLLNGLGASTGVVRTNVNGNRIVVIQSPGLTDAAPAVTGADFGVTRAELGNFVWEDSDGDGLFDVGEPPVPGVTVQLFTPADVAVGAPVVTSAAGAYTVPTLPAGTYYAQFTLDPTAASPAGVPAAYLGSLLRTATYSGVNPAPAPGAADENDLSAQIGLGRVYRTPSFAISAGSVNVGVDAALFQPVAVAGSVFYDLNFNNVNNGAPSDAPLQATDVRVIHTGPDRTLGTADDLTPFSTTTNVGGAYAFDATRAIPPGRLVVQFRNPDSGAFAFVTPNVGADEGADSDVTGTTLVVATTYGLTDALDATSDQALAKLDAGFTGTTTLSGTAFVDGTANGVRGEASDGALEGVEVALDLSFTFGANPLTLSRAPLTDATGAYSFDKLPTGSFDLAFTPPTVTPGYIETYADVADDSDTDSDGASATDGLLNQSLIGGAAERRDHGYYQPVTVSGQVWFDSDNDGVRDAGEPPLANMPVEVISLGADNAIGGGDDTSDSVITAADGSYSSDGTPTLLPGQFVVRVTNPSTSDFQFLTSGTDNDIRSSVAGPPATGSTSSFGVVSGATVANVDAALTGIKLLNGRTFVDANGDGQSGGDSGLPGVQVDLSHVVNVTVGPTTYLNTTFTRTLNSVAPGGVYNFLNLPGGTFSLSFTPPTATPAWQLTTANVAPDASDSDGDLTGQTLAAGDTAQTRDQGYFQPVTITARVFDEQVAVNNSFQPGEPGLSGITVDLTGNVSDSDTTDATGLVTFTVQPGTYSLTLPSDPASFLRSPGNSGSVGGITVTSGQAASTAPFGYYKQSTISGTAWFDSDGDDLLTVGEPGMEGLTVTLEGSGGSTQTAITDANGAYSFSGVDPTGLGGVKVTPQDSGGSLSAIEPNGLGGGDASYRLCFSLPADFAYVGKGAALLTDDNSDVNPSGPDAGCTDSFTLGSNTTLSTLDAGYVGALTIGDLVWADLNGDGLQTTGEPGLAGATVTVAISTTGGLINSSDPTITLSTTSTASLGLAANYQLAGVPPGSGWRVLSVAPPFGYLPSATNQGSDDALDSDPSGAYPVALPPAVANLDFGFYQATSVGDLVWLDLNDNSSYDAASERGVPGVRVDLLKDGSQVATQITAASGQVGSYGFVDITPGTYSLRFTAPAGYVFANDGAGSLESDGDNDARLDGTTASLTLISGQIRAGVDAGLRGTGGVSGLAWIDDNTNAIRDASDTRRIGGVQVTLSLTPTLTGDTASYTATTAADGSYSFTGLPAGAGTLRFSAAARYQAVQANVGADTSDSDGPVVPLTIASGVALANVDQGYKELGRVIFLPLLRGVPQRPDLTVAFTVSPETPTAGKPASITATVTNKGTGPASGFWVDLYINPSHAPLVNEPWNELCTLEPCFGMAWFYEGTLQPGQSATLTSSPSSAANPNGFRAASSNWSGFFANGTSRIYIIVDSWNRNASGEQRDPNGALSEIDETNNRAERSLTVLLGPLPPEFLQATLTSEFTRNEP